MSVAPPTDRWRARAAGCLVVAAAVVVAVVGAQDHTAGWNDASRLAVVESLVDYHTLSIDESHWTPQTADKMRIDGRFYSDKPPVQMVLMAGLYQVLQTIFGLRAADQEAVFCRVMTAASSGLAYVAAVWCVYRLGRPLGLSLRWRLLLAASFGLCTVAVVYSRTVNNHVVELALAAGVFLLLAELAGEQRPKRERGILGPKRERGAGLKSLADASASVPRFPLWRLLALGTLAGSAYAVDQPVGGLLLVGTVAVAAARLGTVRKAAAAVGLIGLAALPWLVLHHALTYAVAGTIGPPNANPAVFDYPGSPFHAHNLTGRWNHGGVADFVTYAWSLLFSERGIVVCNPALLLALPAAGLLLLRARAARPEVLLACLWCLGVWLVYAALSNDGSGGCCSVRWFVPLLAAGYYVLALLVRDYPEYRPDLLLLSAWGAVLVAVLWWCGPWYYQMPRVEGWPLSVSQMVQAGLWPSWAACRLWLWRRRLGWPPSAAVLNGGRSSP